MMAYVESFARAMERARASVSYWDRKTLDHLQAAHDAEMRQCSKSEYHRGYEDGKATKSADQWQLDRERARIIRKLDALRLNADGGSHYNLSTVCKAVYEPSFGWTMGACERLRDRLIALLGTQDAPNATNFAGNQQNGPKSGEKAPEMQRDVPESRESLQEVEPSPITDERHKVVCRLRKFEPRIGGKPTEEASKLIRCIIGREDCHVACGNDLEEARDRLIHLLGGGECNFSGAENDTGMQDDGANPAETSEGQGDSVSFGTPSSITSELRKFAETFRYEWYDVKDGSFCYTISDCPPSLDSVNMTDYINGIADRIEEQFARCCKLWERTATDTAQEVHDSMEAECNELARDVEMWRDRSEDMRHERDELLDKLQAISVLCEQDDG